MILWFARRLSDLGKTKYLASLLALKLTTPKSVPLSLFKIVITLLFFICD